MNKKIILGAIISTCIIVMMSSVSAVEYRVADDHNTTVMLSKIDKTLEKFTSFFKNIKIDLKLFTSTQDGKFLVEKITELKTTMINNPSRPTCIGFILGLIFAVIGTIFGIIFGPLLALLILILVSPAIILAKIIVFIVKLISILIP